MIDIQLIREDRGAVYDNISLKCMSIREAYRLECLLDDIYYFDRAIRDDKQTMEMHQHEMNTLAKQFGRFTPEERERNKPYLSWLKEEIAAYESKAKEDNKKLRGMMMEVPNMVHPSVPLMGRNTEDALVALELALVAPKDS